MSLKITVSVKGLSKLRANWRKAPMVVYRDMTRGIRQASQKITTSVKQVTPVDTGRLKGGIRPEYGKLKAVIKPHNADYGWWVHEGTTKMRARPFMKIGLKNVEGEVDKILGKTLDAIIKKL